MICGLNPPLSSGVPGEVTERLKVRDWKSRGRVIPPRGFESHPLRSTLRPRRTAKPLLASLNPSRETAKSAKVICRAFAHRRRRTAAELQQRRPDLQHQDFPRAGLALRLSERS